MESARRRPTLEDLDALPRDMKGKIIEGVLYTMTRPFDAVPLDVRSLWS